MTTAQQHDAAEAFMARSFEAVQHVRVQHDGRSDEGDAQLWLQPGVGFRFRVLSPFGSVAFEVGSWRCAAFEKRAGAALVVTRVSEAKFPFAAFAALLAPMSGGTWRDGAYAEPHRRIVLGDDGQVSKVEGEGVSVKFSDWASVEGKAYPKRADFVLPTDTRLHVDNREVSFAVSPAAEALPELRAAVEACQ